MNMATGNVLRQLDNKPLAGPMLTRVPLLLISNAKVNSFNPNSLPGHMNQIRTKVHVFPLQHSWLLASNYALYESPWWRHQMEPFSALLDLCAGNSPVTGQFPSQRPVAQTFDVFFDLRLKTRLSYQSYGWWFETSSCPLWRHCNATEISVVKWSLGSTWRHWGQCVNVIGGDPTGRGTTWLHDHSLVHVQQHTMSVGHQ